MVSARRINARLHPVFVCQQNVLADRAALVLGDGAHQGEDQAAGGLVRADVLLLKNDGHISGAQQLGVALALHDVAGEAGDALAQDQVDLSVHGVLHELLKALPVSRVRARESVIHIAPCVLPIGVLLDLFHVLLDLEMNGKGLIDVVCGNTAIGCDAQHTVFFGRSGGSGDHAHVSAIHGFDSGGMPI